jgi:hypothetical protein
VSCNQRQEGPPTAGACTRERPSGAGLCSPAGEADAQDRNRAVPLSSSERERGVRQGVGRAHGFAATVTRCPRPAAATGGLPAAFPVAWRRSHLGADGSGVVTVLQVVQRLNLRMTCLAIHTVHGCCSRSAIAKSGSVSATIKINIQSTDS